LVGHALGAAVGRIPSRSESTFGVAAGTARILGSSRPEKRQERRGPERGAAGREEQGPEEEIPWVLRLPTGFRQVLGGKNRREGSQTLRADVAGEWNPRVDRIPKIGTCRRERNSMRAVSRPTVLARGGVKERKDRTLQRRAKHRCAAFARGGVRRERPGKTPGRSRKVTVEGEHGTE
jgi:hypothetical protein